MENNSVAKSKHKDMVVQTSCYVTHIYVLSVVLGILSALGTGPGCSNRNPAGRRWRKTNWVQTGLTGTGAVGGGHGCYMHLAAAHRCIKTQKSFGHPRIRALTDKPVSDTVDTVTAATKAASVGSPDFLLSLTIYLTRLFYTSVPVKVVFRCWPTLEHATVAKKNSGPTGRNREQDQAHVWDPRGAQGKRGRPEGEERVHTS